MRVLMKSPVREFCTPGSVTGLTGDCQIYVNERKIKIKPIKTLLLRNAAQY
jgi:hypothetical protein